MASQLHLLQLDNDDSSTSSSSSSGTSSSDSDLLATAKTNNDHEEEEEAEVEEPARRQPPKVRLKLSLRIPKITQPATPADDSDDDDDEPETPRDSSDKYARVTSPEPQEVEAMEVDDDDDDDDDDDNDDDENMQGVTESQDHDVLKATVVASDDDEAHQDDEVETETVENQLPPSSNKSKKNKGDGGSAKSGSSTKPSASVAAAAKAAIGRRSPTAPVQNRPVRLPPMSSPGLLIPPTTGVYRGGADANGFTTPASVFDHNMSLVGYTTEARTEKPHRGSSVKRVVDDMFDSNVHFTLHFPPLVPEELWNGTAASKKIKAEDAAAATTSPSAPEEMQVDGNGVSEEKKEDTGETLPDLLLRALCKPSSSSTATDIQDDNNVPPQNSYSSLADMAPVSLTLPYPEAYLQKRHEYVKQVESRERAIIASQEAAEAAEDAKEAYEDALAAYNSSNKKGSADNENKDTNGNSNAENNGAPVPPPEPTPVVIPPIPVPPSPPHESEMSNGDRKNPDEGKTSDTGIIDNGKSSTKEEKGDTSKSHHPIYLPKGKESLVEHLDKQYFHIAEGRYYGLLTSTIADPHFVGPNAPGITGLSVSGGTGLATSYAGSGGSGGAGPSQAYYGGSVGGGSGSGGGGSSVKVSGGGDSGNSFKSKKSGGNVLSPGASGVGGSSVASSSGNSKKGKSGPPTTSNAMDLKRLMEHGEPDLVSDMRRCIIRAAVYASRTSVHGGSFVGVNKETYPDVSKAFAAHAGLRPCNRCKNNKQGAYHCRLRRKHKDLDYDGGNSWETLSPLFEEPIENLRL